jgi:hypothetical protein
VLSPMRKIEVLAVMKSIEPSLSHATSVDRPACEC